MGFKLKVFLLPFAGERAGMFSVLISQGGILVGLVLSNSRYTSSCKQLHSLSSLAHLCRGDTIYNTGTEAASSLGVESETQHVASSQKSAL